MQIYAVLDPTAKAGLYGDAMRAALSVDGSGPAASVERFRSLALDRDPLGQMMYVDLRLWLPDDLLLVGDKMSMVESVEMRVPFLDRSLVEFVESLPTSYKVRRGVRKLIHKQAMSELLPRQIVHRKERGFKTPVDRWLRGPELSRFAAETLLDPGAVSVQVLNRGAVEALLTRHRTGVADHTRQLFCLLSLELWARRFLAAQPAPA
jgi:asparagine synthase (glutamine-hydrolysing)